MIEKLIEKEKAIKLRKEGKTYSEILKVVPVAKSTISLWFKEVGLSVPEKQRITEARIAASKRGGQAKRKQRIEKQEQLFSKAKSEIQNISKREIFLLGVALYWAEGAKEKEYKPGSPIRFANSDPNMIQFFLVWLMEVMEVDKSQIYLDIYIHENHKYRISDVISYWAKETSFSVDSFNHVYYKKNKIKTLRKKVDEASYFGLIRVTVRSSSYLVRMITGWVSGIVEKVNK